MNCKKYLNLADELIEGEIGVQDSRAANAHLLVCPQCAAHYQSAQREKEIYASYLPQIAPPADLWVKFQAKLNSETERTAPVSEALPAADWQTKIFALFRLYPALGLAALLIALGAVLLRFEPPENKYLVETNLNAAPPTAENYPDQMPALPARTDGEKPFAAAAVEKDADKSKVANRAANSRTAHKPSSAAAKKTNGKMIPANRKKQSPAESQLNERQLQLIALEKAAARQIEKTELLLRAFRNAQTDDAAEIDLEYEKAQARRLLDANVRLRQTAESYGDLSTLEILNRVEPFLLDIANLEKRPLPERVSDIKERVKNQNIIASLQIY